MIVLICYDVLRDSKRTKIAKTLEREGYERLQKSIFIGEASLQFHKQRFHMICEFADEETDRIMVMPLVENIGHRSYFFGNREVFDEYLNPPGHVFI